MDAVLELAASLLSFAHSIFGPGFCPGDWVWATSTAGALIALLPTLGALVIALVRKFTGNLYNTATISVFAVVGGVFGLLLPWLLFNGVGTVYNRVFAGQPVPLSKAELASFGDRHCWVDSQAEYLGGRANAYEVLFHPFESTPMYLLRLLMLVIVPALCLLFVLLQGRLALRRGPKWPGRLLWGPFALMVLLTLPVEANTAAHLWAGFLLFSVLGLIPVLVVGPPSWAVIERNYQRPEPARPDQGPRPETAARPVPPPPPARPVGPPQPTRVDSALAVQNAKVVPPTHGPPTAQQGQPLSGPLPGQGQPLSGPLSGQGQPLMSGQQPPLLSGQQPPPYQPPPPLPPYQPEGAYPAHPPTLRGEPEGAALAADPGPLPFTPRGAAAPPPSIRPTGSRFRKVRALGRGGFGTVWLAVDTQLDRTVAVKMAHAPDAETEERMLREARALAAVHHPNCVRVYDIVSEPEGLGLVMEYIEGQPLADRVTDGGPLDDVAAARLWITMAGALAAAHAKGVLHRDVKPSNIIIDPDGNAHLIDFGIARSKGDSTLTATGMMVGTPDFLASETAAGANATPASDAWQLAATVSYALTGKPPRGNRENAMAALMAAAKSEPLTEIPKQSAHLRLLTAALDNEPRRRPTLQAVARELSDWLAREGHTETGPVTQIVRREDIEDRTRPMR
ncbi:serine/threonine-protein kinase [Actinokineospora sp. UTMC 2448]|uniref:serine/threonine-protein kinase n=1 Tax=Actinokineospora sp. UTMC 2448 TaxID=2268449 RepID=UPI00216465B7|nr:protein kinase [Actinokineospora sp. UTMC 2448]